MSSIREYHEELLAAAAAGADVDPNVALLDPNEDAQVIRDIDFLENLTSAERVAVAEPSDCCAPLKRTKSVRMTTDEETGKKLDFGDDDDEETEEDDNRTCAERVAAAKPSDCLAPLKARPVRTEPLSVIGGKLDFDSAQEAPASVLGKKRSNSVEELQNENKRLRNSNDVLRTYSTELLSRFLYLQKMHCCENRVSFGELTAREWFDEAREDTEDFISILNDLWEEDIAAAEAENGGEELDEVWRPMLEWSETQTQADNQAAVQDLRAMARIEFSAMFDASSSAKIQVSCGSVPPTETDSDEE